MFDCCTHIGILYRCCKMRERSKVTWGIAQQQHGSVNFPFLVWTRFFSRLQLEARSNPFLCPKHVGVGININQRTQSHRVTVVAPNVVMRAVSRFAQRKQRAAFVERGDRCWGVRTIALSAAPVAAKLRQNSRQQRRFTGTSRPKYKGMAYIAHMQIQSKGCCPCGHSLHERRRSGRRRSDRRPPRRGICRGRL